MYVYMYVCTYICIYVYTMYICMYSMYGRGGVRVCVRMRVIVYKFRTARCPISPVPE
jgi:hypothetical protein